MNSALSVLKRPYEVSYARTDVWLETVSGFPKQMFGRRVKSL